MTHRFTRLALATALSLSVAAPALAATMPKKEPTAGQLAARERRHTCSAEWKAAKAEHKVDKDMKWPKFWSACNKRLKGGDKA
jgi:hypothetical protein